MKNLDEFYIEVRPEVPGCPIAVMNRALVNAAIEFCDRTLTWRTEIDTQGVNDGTNEYDLEVPSCGRVAAVLYVGHDDVRVVPGNERNLDDRLTGWRRSTAEADIAEYYYLPNRKTIRLALTPASDSSSGLDIFCAFKPIPAATQLPDNLYDDHLEAIGWGAKARLMLMSGAAWANPALAGIYSESFQSAIVKERAERFNDYTRESDLIIRPPSYWS